MADLNVSRFKKIADESTATSKARSENLGLSRDTSISSLAESAKKQVEATTQDVAQYSTDSGSSKTASAITTITGIMSLISTGVSTYKAIKGGGKSSSSGSGNASGAAAASSGDPVNDIAKAINQHQQVRSKDSQRALTDAIATGNSKITELTTKKTGLEEEVTALSNKNDNDYKAASDALKNDIQAQDKIITDSDKTIDLYNNAQDALKTKATELKKNESKVDENISKTETEKSKADKNVVGFETKIGEIEGKEVKLKAENEEDIKNYQDCLGKKDELAQTTQKAESSHNTSLSTLDGLKNKKTALEQTIKSNKKADNSSATNTAKTQLDKVKEDIKKEEENAKKLKDNLEKAKSDEKNNNKQISNYEKRITVGEKTLAEVKAEAESAKTAKTEAEKTLNAKCEELKAYVKVQEETADAADTTADKAKEVEAKKELTNEQLKKAVTGKDESIKLQDDYTKAKELNNKAIEEKKAQIKELNTEINKIANAVKQGNTSLGLEVLNDQLPSMAELEVDDSKVDATVDGKKVSLEKVSDGKYKIAGSTDGKLYTKDGKEIKADAKLEKSAGNPKEEKAGQVVKPDAKPTTGAKDDNQWTAFNAWNDGEKVTVGNKTATKVTSADGKTKAYEVDGKYYALDNYGGPDLDKEIDKKDFKK